MIVSALMVLLPILFVIGLGYAAGREKKFTAEQVMGLNELVLVYALPALMFVGTVTTTRTRLLEETAYLLGVFLATIGLFAAAVFVSVFVLRHSLGEAAIHANLVTFPSVAFLGVPIFTGLFGSASIVPVATATVISCGILVPLTVVLLEMHQQRCSRDADKTASNALMHCLLTSVKEPMVWAPLLGVLLVLTDIAVPQEIDNMLKLLGSATSGTLSLFGRTDYCQLSDSNQSGNSRQCFDEDDWPARAHGAFCRVTWNSKSTRAGSNCFVRNSRVRCSSTARLAVSRI